MISAKFKVSKHTKWSDNNTGEVELTPDYAQGRNKDWSEATPAGVIRMTITVPTVFEQFLSDRHLLFYLKRTTNNNSSKYNIE